MRGSTQQLGNGLVRRAHVDTLAPRPPAGIEAYGIKAWHGTYKNTSKILILQKKAIRAINNIAYNEHTNTYFKCNKILILSDQYKIQVSNYVFQLSHSNIDEKLELSLLVNNKI